MDISNVFSWGSDKFHSLIIASPTPNAICDVSNGQAAIE